ncbi:hypothetical protein CTEN210_12086 [Chaetoceros tenuissimus]|uniref:Uncharacterized protein n=1 Tax=Chaetoceros tenuissimus TaxID=426638 RepID=A0AAD3H9R2_9STRA|nr:hypothetical protein CTEN210_12086 [Chaetoceros tenuissimus]
METAEAARRNDSRDDIEVVELEVLSTSGSIIRPSRSLQQQCPDVDDMIEEILGQGNISKGVSGEIASWFENIGDSGFIEELIEEIIDVALEQKLGVFSGSKLEEDYPLCKNLPLKGVDCFLTAYPSPDYSFFEKLIADNVPFAKDIINARDTVNKEIDFILKDVRDVGDEIEEKRKSVVAAVDQFFGPLNPNGPAGSCAVLNKHMLGIYESPGAPAPSWYDFCNCISMKSDLGIWKCPVQFFIRGLAVGGSGKLLYDPEIPLKIYDGFIEYVIDKVEGDAWIGFALKFVVPKVPKGVKPNDFVCIPPVVKDILAGVPGGSIVDLATKKKRPTNVFTIEFVGSLFIKNDLNNNDGELLALAAIGDSAPTTIFLKDYFLAKIKTPISAMLRVRSENPDCFPSGLFFNANIDTSKMTIRFEKKLSKFFFVTTPKVNGDGVGSGVYNVSSGVTWKDRGAVNEEDIIQSFFLKVRKEIKFLGIELAGEIEFQYFDKAEFARRKDVKKNVDKCCNNNGGFVVTDCSIPETGLMQAMNQPYIQFEEQRTLGIFAGIDDLDFWGIVIINEISLVVILQIPEDDLELKLLVRFAADVKVLIFDARAEIVFAVTESWALAKFEGKVTINGGEVAGKATLVVKAKAEIGEMLYIEQDPENGDTANDDRQLAAEPDFKLSDADWDISVDLQYNPPQWVEDVGKAIAKGVKLAYEAVSDAVEVVTELIEKAFEAMIGLAEDLGEVLSKVFDAVSDWIDNTIGRSVDKAVYAIVEAMAGRFGPLEDIVEFGGEVISFTVDAFSGVFKVASKFLSGDFKEAGFELAYLLGKEEFKRWEYRPGDLGCNDTRKVVNECTDFGLLGKACTKKYKDWQQNITCLSEKVVILNKINSTAIDARNKGTCRDTSKDRNKGLIELGVQDEASVKQTLNVGLSFESVSFGKASDLSKTDLNSGLCKKVPYNVKVGKIVSNSSDLVETSVQQDTVHCIDFNSEESINSTLGRFQSEKGRAADAAKGAALADVGLNDELKSCQGLTNCTALQVEEEEGFSTIFSITCRDTLSDFRQYFGSVDITQDSRCQTEPSEFFRIKGGSQPSNCETAQVFIEREVEGCCGDPVTFQYTLNVEPLPPTFIPQEGSLDVVTTCDANIDYSVLEIPKYTSGCEYSDNTLYANEKEPEFDISTCRTSITRTFELTENGCDAFNQTFSQEITLTNDYLPEFESFPPDVTIDIFDEYGTDALGFPTAFQRCGLPVTITYSDVISEGQCFAERILQRTFKIIDECGHQNERTQTITIANDKSRLPYSFKSLANLYAHYKLDAKYLLSYPSKKTKSCSIDSARCNITGTFNQECKSGDFESEFQPYESMLLTLLEKRMSPGPSKRNCVCIAGDAECDVRENIDTNADVVVQYGTQVTSAPGRCVVDESVDLNHEGIVEMYEVKCPVKATKSPKSRRDLSSSKSSSSKSSKSSSQKSNKTSKSSKGSNACFEKALLGTNQVYNFFNISVLDLSNATIYIDTPSTSITYVHVHVPEDVYKKVYFGKRTMGVRLAEGMTSHNILWHIPKEVDLKMDSDLPVGWSFYGTLLNHFGKVKLKASEYNPVSWQGQIFADEIKVYDDLEIECGGHFAGFVPCENVME